MRKPHVYAYNFIKAIVYKIHYQSRVEIGLIQSFDKIRIEIAKRGKLHIGSYNQNRGQLYIGVMNGGLLSIGDHCFFNMNSSITCKENIEIGDNCKFGNNLVIVDHDHNFRGGSEEFISSPIKIEDNVWIGANVVILRGSVIGNGSVIGAGSVIKGSVPAGSVVIPYQNAKIRSIE